MSITVIVAKEYELEGEECVREIVLDANKLSGSLARRARNKAFKNTWPAVVAHGWNIAFRVPGSRDNRGDPRQIWPP